MQTLVETKKSIVGRAQRARDWGTAVHPHGTYFSVWAPEVKHMELVLSAGKGKIAEAVPMQKDMEGNFDVFVEHVAAGARYGFRVDGKGPFPDPVSRFQPDGVHGLSQVVDPSEFEWSDGKWTGIPFEKAVIYELHVGTFTPEGTFNAAREWLSYLAYLGVTAVELMPVADFPGNRNWGYDGVSLFAPARCYGTPDDLRRFVDTAHGLGLAVFLDAVYNHLGPDGNYLGVYSPYYFTPKHKSPWGDGINLDDKHSDKVRKFFIQNALQWIHEYHFDGLRLDATHALIDDSPRHFLSELTSAVKNTVKGRQVSIVAEDSRNLARLIKPVKEGGWGVDGVWADDFHHHLRRLLAGDRDGYYMDFTGEMPDIASTLEKGWFYRGQLSHYMNGPRGTDPAGLSLNKFVICLQNHDQVGNRALGERLSHQVDLAAYRAATAVLLFAPETPLLFMGQEWAASSPFLYFTDHNPELGRLVTKGRREEFKNFKTFSDPAMRKKIPDPQDVETFNRSHLNWQELYQEPHASMLRYYKKLLYFRQETFHSSEQDNFKVEAAGESALILRRNSHVAVVQLKGDGIVSLPPTENNCPWQLLFTSEDDDFCVDSEPPFIMEDPTGGLKVRFLRPGAVILRSEIMV